MEMNAGAVTLRHLEGLLEDWHVARYGRSGVRLHETALKLQSEVGEFADALLLLRASNANVGDAVEELADITIICFHLARGLGRSLGQAILAKLEVLNRRLADPHAGRKTDPADPRRPGLLEKIQHDLAAAGDRRDWNEAERLERLLADMAAYEQKE